MPSQINQRAQRDREGERESLKPLQSNCWLWVLISSWRQTHVPPMPWCQMGSIAEKVQSKLLSQNVCEHPVGHCVPALLISTYDTAIYLAIYLIPVSKFVLWVFNKLNSQICFLSSVMWSYNGFSSLISKTLAVQTIKFSFEKPVNPQLFQVPPRFFSESFQIPSHGLRKFSLTQSEHWPS